MFGAQGVEGVEGDGVVACVAEFDVNCVWVGRVINIDNIHLSTLGSNSIVIANRIITAML